MTLAALTGLRCRSCGAPIIWLRTRSGSNMPVDADTVPLGDDGPFDPKVHTSHFATCPHAREHRRPRKTPGER